MTDLKDIGGYAHHPDLYYHPEFCWVRKIEGDLFRVGLVDFYQKLAGEIEYVDMPGEGEDISRGERIGTVQTGKWIGKLISPVTGTIEAANENIQDEPDLINSSPFEEGWLLEIRLSDPGELAELLSGEEAEGWLRSEIEKHA